VFEPLQGHRRGDVGRRAPLDGGPAASRSYDHRVNAPLPSEHPDSRTARSDNVLATVLLFLLLLLVAAFLSFRAMFLGFWVDACGVVTIPCEPGLFRAGRLAGVFSPWVIFVVALLLSIVLIAIRRRAFWVPLLAIVLAVGSHIVASVLVDLAMQA